MASLVEHKEMDLDLSVENLQLFLNAFYNEITDYRRKINKLKNYQYNNGNQVKYILSIKIRNCIISGVNMQKKDMICVKFKTVDGIVCSFNILLEKLKEFDFEKRGIQKKTLILPPI
jgi:hypothetical protein